MSSSLQSLPRPTKTYHAHTYGRIAKHHGFTGRGKTVLITGGAGGVGLSIAQAFAAAGVARIAIVSRSPDAQAKAKAELEAAHPSVQVLTYSTSVTDGTRLSEILLELGTIDVLVLNAAVTHRQVPSIEITEDVVRDTFDINVVATFNLAKAFLCMPRQGQGQSDPRTVIYVSSAVTQILGRCVAYASSKAAGSQMM
jgi:NAD(P)-dependent dehydrogenase (short-subunit alcohol dehydrogenase family)